MPSIRKIVMRTLAAPYAAKSGFQWSKLIKIADLQVLLRRDVHMSHVRPALERSEGTSTVALSAV